MEYNLYKESKLFMIYDILGDLERTGPLLWKIDRKRLESVKEHTFDVLLIARILRPYLPPYLNFDKMNDYIMCHDLAEAITGDITKFEGVSDSEIKRVTNIAINYLIKKFGDILDIKNILINYENKIDIESKLVNMIDKVHSATTFIKYESENHIDMNNPEIIPCLRNHPFVIEKKLEGKDLADIFFKFHIKSIKFSEEEIKKYNLSVEDANKIIDVIKSFAYEIYNQKQVGPWVDVKKEFPIEAMEYNRNK